MRALNQNELTAVSGGTYCQPKPACAPKPVCAPVTTSCTSPLAYFLGFIGGAIKLLCTGVPSVSTPCTPCTPTPPCGSGTPTGGVIN